MMTAMPPATARARARAEITGEILAAARSQLAEHGSAALSLRAVAREVGMVSSAVYRYFPSRDALLTALIVEAYDGVGSAAEAAAVAATDATRRDRWAAICRAIRAWAIARPHEYALIYGSPVPGYEAPTTTIGPATRAAATLIQVLVDEGHDKGHDEHRPVVPLGRPLPATLGPDIARLRETFRGVPDPTIARGLIAWSALFGTISFELFGQFHNVIDDRDAWFDLAIAELADFVGL